MLFMICSRYYINQVPLKCSTGNWTWVCILTKVIVIDQACF